MRTPLAVAAAALISLSMIGSAAAAAEKPAQWPFGLIRLPNPALGLLQKIDDVKVAISKTDPKLITITVQATASRPGYTDLTLVDRPGPLDDMTFAFTARGRPPENPSFKPEPTAVTLTGTYKDAPLAKVQHVEIIGRDNCIDYSVASGTSGKCTIPMPHSQDNDLL